jgi:hypothetical protein
MDTEESMESFTPGDRVVHIESGEKATVHRSDGGRSHVFWDGDQPREDFGGSVVADTLLRIDDGETGLPDTH